jgi:hypothetical protein
MVTSDKALPNYNLDTDELQAYLNSVRARDTSASVLRSLKGGLAKEWTIERHKDAERFDQEAADNHRKIAQLILPSSTRVQQRIQRHMEAAQLHDEAALLHHDAAEEHS